MKDIILPFLSRKFLSAHFGVLAVFIIAVLSKDKGIDASVAMAAIGAVTTLLTAYQAGNTISKKFDGTDSAPKP